MIALSQKSITGTVGASSRRIQRTGTSARFTETRGEMPLTGDDCDRVTLKIGKGDGSHLLPLLTPCASVQSINKRAVNQMINSEKAHYHPDLSLT